MNTYENVMVTAMEECAEVQQAISKALRFGLDNTLPNEPEKTNRFQILEEYCQLQAVMELLMDRSALGLLKEEEINAIKTKKIKNVDKYQKYSIELGLVQLDEGEER